MSGGLDIRPVEVTREEARRIAVRAQLLDGSASDVLSTVRRLGSLQLDPISAVAPPQHLVLWSRLGNAYDRSELDRLLWEERKLFEWDAFVYPIEDYPFVRARMLRTRGKYAFERRGDEFMKTNAALRRYLLRELERRGPVLSRDLEDRSPPRGAHRWYGSRNVAMMLEQLHKRGLVAVVGRRGGQRVWDLGERWYPEMDPVPLEEAERVRAERGFRALGVRLENGTWRAHPDAGDGPVPKRVTMLSPFDRLIYDRERAEALFDFSYRLEMYVPKAKRQYGYYVLPILQGDRIVGRADPVFDRKTGILHVNAVFAERDAPAGAAEPIAAAFRSLAEWLGSGEVRYTRRVPKTWKHALR